MPYKNKEDRNKNRREKHRKYKLYLIKHKYNSDGCTICGYDNHPEILQFHHKKPELKLFNFSDGSVCNRRQKVIDDEIKKCILLCPNCHFWLHYQEKDKK